MLDDDSPWALKQSIEPYFDLPNVDIVRALCWRFFAIWIPWYEETIAPYVHCSLYWHISTFWICNIRCDGLYFFINFSALSQSLLNLVETCELFSTSCADWKFKIQAQESCRLSDFSTLGMLEHVYLRYQVSLMWKPVNCHFSEIVRISSFILLSIN